VSPVGQTVGFRSVDLPLLYGIVCGSWRGVPERSLSGDVVIWCNGYDISNNLGGVLLLLLDLLGWVKLVVVCALCGVELWFCNIEYGVLYS